MASGSSSTSSESVICSGCSNTYGDFCISYVREIHLLVEFGQRHGVLPVTHLCVTCGELCRIDFSKRALRCDKSYWMKGRRRKRCNYYKSIYHKTWFDHTKLEIETNLRFVVLWLKDWWAYKVTRTKLALADSTICDWCSFCREVVVFWELSNKEIRLEGLISMLK